MATFDLRQHDRQPRGARSHTTGVSMKVRGPLLTLGAVAAVGVALLLVNISQEPDRTPSGKPVAQSTTTAAPAPSTAPAPPPPVQFPAKADYVGKIPTSSGVITLEITINSTNAIAYACDGSTVETWLRGSAQDGVVSLANKDKTSRLEGRLDGNNVVGTLWIGEKKWDFTTAPAQPPAGLYVYNQNGVRSSWIIDQNGSVTGVQRQPDGSTSPAPSLSTNGTAQINGQTVTATRVEGNSDVI
jgi:hypothetical protein